MGAEMGVDDFARALEACLFTPPMPEARTVGEAKAPETAEQAGRGAAPSVRGHDRDASGGVTRAECDAGHPILGRRGALGGFAALDADGDAQITVSESRRRSRRPGATRSPGASRPD